MRSDIVFVFCTFSHYICQLIFCCLLQESRIAASRVAWTVQESFADDIWVGFCLNKQLLKATVYFLFTFCCYFVVVVVVFVIVRDFVDYILPT